MRLVDDEHRSGVGNGVDGAVEIAEHLVVVVAREQLAVGQQLRVEQQHVYLALHMVRAIEEMTHGGRHVEPSLLALLLRFEHAHFHLGVIATHRLKMALYLRLRQKRGRAGLDGQCRHGDDKLVDAATPVQLKHGASVDIGLARARLHLYVEHTMPRKGLYLVWQHAWGDALLFSFRENATHLAHSSYGLAIERLSYDGVLVACLRRLLYGGLHYRGDTIHGNGLMPKVAFEFQFHIYYNTSGNN